MQNILQRFLTLKEQFFGKISSKLKDAKTLKSVPNEYTCQYCKETKPLTEEHFQKVRNFKYGFSTVCNECSKPKQKD
jgi:protein-disulfide isomerase